MKINRSLPFLIALAFTALLQTVAGARPIHVFLAGDSTCAEKPPAPENPERGWGEALPFFFDHSVSVDNRALNGHSSLSFRTEGHWDALLAASQPGDWVLIQFGHDDEQQQDPSRYAAAQTDYRANLRRFVEEVRAKDAHPILATPIVRRHFNEEGALVPTHGDYPDVVREVAEAMQVPLLDLQKTTQVWVAGLGPVASKWAYLWPVPGHYAYFPTGKEDDTHLSIHGASVVAQMAVNLMRERNLDLAKHLRDGLPDFQTTEWIRLYPDGMLKPSSREAEEVDEGHHVYKVQNPTIGVFRTTIGTGPRPAVVVCPGGGYSRLAIEKEGYEVAHWLNAVGIDAFVLRYRMKEFGYPAPLQDVTRAIRFLRSQADAREIDPGRIGVLGFSAGGHLAGMATTLWDSPDSAIGDALDAVSARPDFSVMVYPVVTMKSDFTHRGSRRNLLGEDPSEAMIDALSLETRVRPETPPVFLLTTDTDATVPAENSLQFATALRANGVPVELHLFKNGPHGIGMRPGFGPMSTWPQLLAGWLLEEGVIERRP